MACTLGFPVISHRNAIGTCHPFLYSHCVSSSRPSSLGFHIIIIFFNHTVIPNMQCLPHSAREVFIINALELLIPLLKFGFLLPSM